MPLEAALAPARGETPPPAVTMGRLLPETDRPDSPVRGTAPLSMLSDLQEGGRIHQISDNGVSALSGKSVVSLELGRAGRRYPVRTLSAQSGSAGNQHLQRLSQRGRVLGGGGG